MADTKRADNLVIMELSGAEDVNVRRFRKAYFAESGGGCKTVILSARLFTYNDDNIMTPIKMQTREITVMLEVSGMRDLSKDGRVVHVEAYLVEDSTDQAKEARERFEADTSWNTDISILDGTALQKGAFLSFVYDGNIRSGYVFSYSVMTEDPLRRYHSCKMCIPYNFRYSDNFQSVLRKKINAVSKDYVLEQLKKLREADAEPETDDADPGSDIDSGSQPMSGDGSSQDSADDGSSGQSPVSGKKKSSKGKSGVDPEF